MNKPIGFHNPYLAAAQGMWMHPPQTSADLALRAAGRYMRHHRPPGAGLSWLMRLHLHVSSDTAWHRVCVQLLNMAALMRQQADYSMARIYVNAARKARLER